MNCPCFAKLEIDDDAHRKSVALNTVENASDSCSGFNVAEIQFRAMKIIVLVCSLLTLAVPSAAKEPWDWHGDGNSLLNFCNYELQLYDGVEISAADQVKAGFCTGFITGVGDLNTTLNEIQKDKNAGFVGSPCMPTGVTTGQVVRVVVKFLKDNPENLHMPAAALTIGAIRKAFPCH